MTLKVVSVAALAATLTATAAQPAPDLFSCLIPSRLATGTFVYEGEVLGRSSSVTMAIARTPAAVRLTYTPIPGVQVVTDLDPASLFSVRGVLSGSQGEIRRWELSADGIRSTGADGTSYLVPTGGARVAFGGSNLFPFLAAAVDWDRCPSVTAAYLVANTRKIESAMLKRIGGTTLPFQGTQTDVVEIAVERPDGTDRVWVSTAPASIPLQFAAETGTGAPFRLISRR
jgi:hypothetical protein